jgi:hypothetical protein
MSASAAAAALRCAPSPLLTNAASSVPPRALPHAGRALAPPAPRCGRSSVVRVAARLSQRGGARRARRGSQRAPVAAAADASSSAPPASGTAPPPAPLEIRTSVRVLPLCEGTQLVRCATADRLRLAAEFALKRGTSDNCYVLRGADATAVIDVPEAQFAAQFAAALAKAPGGAGGITHVVLTHFSGRRADALAALLAARPPGAPALEVWCTNPAARTLRVRPRARAHAHTATHAREREPLSVLCARHALALVLTHLPLRCTRTRTRRAGAAR